MTSSQPHAPAHDTPAENIFASAAYLNALAHNYYPNQPFTIQPFHINNQTVQLLVVNGRPVTSGPFYDYVMPVSPVAQAPAVKFIPQLVTHTIELDERKPHHHLPDTKLDPAPLICWERFATWEEYRAFVKRRSSTNMFKKQANRFERFVADFGEPEFIADDRDPAAFDQCISWKSQQYAGGNATLSDLRAVSMLRELLANRTLVVSSLKFKDSYLAIQISFRWNGRYLGLIPAYDSSLATYGIGKELLHRNMEDSMKSGDREFDMLQGGESYKWYYATHAQIIETAGDAPLGYLLTRSCAALVKQSLMAVSPRLFFGLKKSALQIKRLAITKHQ